MDRVAAPALRRSLLVVSNREPYVHTRRVDGSISAVPSTGGVAVALDALMRERGGTWVAHGSGDADANVVDGQDRVLVPPGEETYTLRRIWLSPAEQQRYYDGFANEGLWPLCHIAHVRPIFRSDDWAEYRAVNARFAEAIADELPKLSSPVFIQDYHLALTAGFLKGRCPGALTALFWHIPWPDPDRLRVCPWRRDIIRGLLANDLLAFQLERDRRNFLMSVRDELTARVESRKSVNSPMAPSHIALGDHTTQVVVAPIGVDFDRIQKAANDPSLRIESSRLVRELRLDEPGVDIIGIGVDRLDYTKGIPERLEAIDRLLAMRPDLRERLAFVQVGVPSRSTIDSYAEIERQIDEKVAEINTRHGQSAAIGPIRYHKSAFRIRQLVALYRLADFCVVSSLHDGMNLVAKEFVAARNDLDGVLVLSEMTGAAQELKEAVIINPYHVEGFAGALERAIAMKPAERMARMRSLRRVVAGHDIFVWASDILESLEQTENVGT